MPAQLFLPGLAPKAERDFLFFALLPDKSEALRILHLREQLCRECHLQGRGRIAARCFHVSLHAIGEYQGVPKDVVRRAEAAAALVSMKPFGFDLDRAMSFVRHGDTKPFVLRAARRSPALVEFYSVLGDAMKRVGFRRVQRSGFAPHLTLLYDAHHVAEREVETVHINADSFALVCSLRGRGHAEHTHLARWPLQAKPDRFGLEEATSPV
jgi:2'-5' RNA ligase